MFIDEQIGRKKWTYNDHQPAAMEAWSLEVIECSTKYLQDGMYI